MRIHDGRPGANVAEWDVGRYARTNDDANHEASLGKMQIVLTVTFVLHIVCFLLMLYRIVVGPTLADRVVAVDLLAYISIGFAVIYAIATEQPVYLEVGLVVGLIAFMSTIIFARYIERVEIPGTED